MLLGNTDIDHPVREFLGKREQPGAARHRRRDCDQPLILMTQFNQRLAEDLCVHRRIADRFQGLAGFNFVW
ncbi:hypothetical protein D3C73_1467320 [compost metagenome]